MGIDLLLPVQVVKNIVSILSISMVFFGKGQLWNFDERAKWSQMKPGLLHNPPPCQPRLFRTPSQTYRGPFQSRKRWGVLEAGPPLFDIMAKPQTPCARRKHMRAMHSGRNWDPQICSRSRYLLRQMVHCNAQQRAKVNTPCSYRCFPGSW